MRYSGYDADGIRRVWAEHDNPDIAETACREEAEAYVRRRPDTGPLARWSYTHDKPRS